jgi:hypothetical protein
MAYCVLLPPFIGSTTKCGFHCESRNASAPFVEGERIQLRWDGGGGVYDGHWSISTTADFVVVVVVVDLFVFFLSQQEIRSE